ncbi:sulfatase [Novipirellula sp.]|uniref:sulfatase family protein n=1 Tax=Novipirellula sp. TaxID=2795430 RepID=UPI003562BE50
MKNLLVAMLFAAFGIPSVAWAQHDPIQTSARVVAEDRPPNFVIIFADDLGYGDLGCFGSTTIKTPNLDKMGAEGMRMTQFYAQTVCGPSRAALMTGCYPLRVAINQNKVEVHPELHSDEITIAEVLKPVGYTSAAFGKWDLAGHHGERYVRSLLPLHQGFDEFFGTSTSNDSKVDLFRGDEVIEKRTDMRLLTQRYTDEAIDFIQRSKDQPFFVYLAHTMPHVKLAVSDAFKGKSDGGLYGDVVQEIDANVGRLLETLKSERLDENTYVIFTSDNGPWYLGRSKGHLNRIGKDAASHGGSAAPLRGAKTSTWEGGLRVPCIFRAPGKIPAGTTCDEIASTMDLLPTFARLAGTTAPTDRVIDGHDIRDLIHGVAGAKSPTDAFFYYRRTRLEAVRSGKWKLHRAFPADPQWSHYSKAEDAIDITRPMLFDLEADIAETKDVADQHPEVVAELIKLIEQARTDIGDHDRIGENARFFDPQPRRPDINKSAARKRNQK